jgi:HK97 family phage portal protein
VDIQLPSGLWVSQKGMEIIEDTKADRILQAQFGDRGGLPDWSAESKFKDYWSFLQAVKIPWVYACTSVIAYNFAATPYDLWVEDEPLQDPDDPYVQLMARPNAIQTGFQFRELMTYYLELTGNAYITLENRDEEGRPRELYLPNPARMRVKPGPEGVQGYVYDWGASAGNMRGSRSQMIPYEPDEVIHLKYANPMDPWYGLGIVEAGATVLDIVTAMSTHELSYWQSGGRIVGVLETEGKLSDDDFQKLKREWQQANADRKQRVRTAILEQGLKYTPIAEGFRSLDIVSIDKSKRDAILAITGVPLPKLGIMEQAQYKMDEADAFFFQETLAPKLYRHEDSMQPLVDLFHPEGYHRHQCERKVFEDDAYKINNANAIATSGWGIVDEARAAAGFEPLPNGNGQIILINSSYTPVPVASMSELAEQTLMPPTPDGSAPPDGGGEPTDGDGGDGDSIRLEDFLTDEQKALVEEQRETKRVRRRAADRELGRKSRGAQGGLDRARNHLRVQAKRAQREGKAAVQGREILPPQRVSSRHPVIAEAARRHFAQAKDRLVELGRARVREALQEQQKLLTERWQTFQRAVKEPTPEARETALRVMWPGAPMGAAIAGIYAVAAPEGQNNGARLLPPAAREKAVRRVLDRKAALSTRETIETKQPKSRRTRKAAEVEEGWGLPPEVQAQFPNLGKLINRDWQQIDQTTLSKIVAAVELGLERGYTPLQIANGYPDEEFGGIAAAFDEAIDYRTEMIARTEAMFAYNAGAWQQFADARVGQLEAVDGIDFDTECRTRNGTLFDMDFQSSEPIDNGTGTTDHPLGTLVFIPISESIDYSAAA